MARAAGVEGLLSALLLMLVYCASGLRHTSHGGPVSLGAGGTEGAAANASARNDGRLRFRPDGTFKILQLTDLVIL